MDIWIGFLALLVGYLFGSISFARILTKIKAPEIDIEEQANVLVADEDLKIPGAYGANAASIATGTQLGLPVALLDMLKTIIPMLVFKHIFKGEPYYLASGVGAFLGHNWPIYYKFQGGRGFAVILGSFFVIDWIAPIATTIAGLFLGMVILGSQELSAVLWMWLMIPWTIWRGGTWEIVYSILISVLYILGAIPEIRLMQRFKKAGKYQEYTERILERSPQFRGMKEMTDKLWIFRPLFQRSKMDKGKKDAVDKGTRL
ncbi:glycerol-3-phosphate acyltransferase [Candidatus Thorarchaeota archaeon]|nr:MAG: glycerol-3-phosphate acyltransferase [Candidatus Thorarchaeota archaeon]